MSNSHKLLAALLGSTLVDLGTANSIDELFERIKGMHQQSRSPEDYRQSVKEQIERTIKAHQAALIIVNRENTPESELVGLEVCSCGDAIVTLTTYRNPTTGEHFVHKSTVGDPQQDKTYNAPDCCAASKIARQIHEKMDDEAREKAMAAAADEASDTVAKAAAATAPAAS